MLTVLFFGLVEGVLIALVAVAFQLHLKVFKFFDLGLAGMYVLASYSFIVFSPMIDNYLGQPISDVLSYFTTVVLLSTTFMATDYFVYRPFSKRRTSNLALLIVSLCVYTIIINCVAAFFGPNIQIISTNYQLPTITFYKMLLPGIQLVQLCLGCFTLIVVVAFFKNSLTGLKIEAIAENAALYDVLGFKDYNLRFKTIIISTFLVSIAAILRTFDSGIDPFVSGFQVILTAATAVILAGVISVYGTILSSLFLGILSNIVAWNFSGNWKEAFIFLFLIAVLLYKKDGLFHIQLRIEQ